MATESALACAFIQDGIKILFLKKQSQSPKNPMELCLPCVLVQQGENPVTALARAVRTQAGIDAQISEAKFEGKYNAGSKKRKILVPALGFQAAAKSARCNPSKEFAGFAWLPLAIAKKQKLARTAEWLKFLP